MIFFTLSLLKLERYCVIRSPLKLQECSNTKFDDKVAAFIDVDIPALNISGWMELKAETNPSIPESEEMYAVGYAEGYLFEESIFNHKNNIKDWFLFKYLHFPDYPEELNEYFRDNLQFTREKSKIHINDKFWREVGNTMSHFDGMVLGYQEEAPFDQFLSELDLYIFVSSGDLLDVVNFALPELRYENLTPEEYKERRIIDNHCSGLIRISSDKKKIFAAETAWFFYGSLTRVHKTYKFNLSASAAKEIVFSSYPGFSYSFDDWYATDAGIMYIETTNNVLNGTLYELCNSSEILAWIRSQVAGRIARNAEEFVYTIRKYNSGTYNNEWLAVDNKKFEKGDQKGIVWLLEEIPGKTAVRDISDVILEKGFFPSYNIPFLDGIYNISGYPNSKLESDSYNDCPRARIFKRDAPNVQTDEDMRRIMRYNNWTAEPEAHSDNETDPGNTICSRYDLRPTNPIGFGGFDAKVGSYDKESKEYEHHIIAGPTVSGGLKPWVFSDKLYCPRRGLKDGPFDYPWLSENITRAWK